MKCGGGSRTRTGDIRLAKPTLYQLSYAPDSAREAGSGSVSVRGEEKFGFSFWEAGEQARRAMCRRVGPSRDVFDELTVGTPDCSGSVSLERR